MPQPSQMGRARKLCVGDTVRVEDGYVDDVKVDDSTAIGEILAIELGQHYPDDPTNVLFLIRLANGNEYYYDVLSIVA